MNRLASSSSHGGSSPSIASRQYGRFFLPQGRKNFSSEHISLFSFSSSSSFRLHPFSFSLRWTWGVLLREEGCVCLLQGKKGVRCCSVRVYALFPNPFWLRECGIRQVSLFGRLLAPNFCLKKMNTKQFKAQPKISYSEKKGWIPPSPDAHPYLAFPYYYNVREYVWSFKRPRLEGLAAQKVRGGGPTPLSGCTKLLGEYKYLGSDLKTYN